MISLSLVDGSSLHLPPSLGKPSFTLLLVNVHVYVHIYVVAFGIWLRIFHVIAGMLHRSHISSSATPVFDRLVHAKKAKKCQPRMPHAVDTVHDVVYHPR